MSQMGVVEFNKEPVWHVLLTNKELMYWLCGARKKTKGYSRYDKLDIWWKLALISLCVKLVSTPTFLFIQF